MANVEKFKFWATKVLPLVYDDSLSYYEFLGKVYEKLNETIDAVNANTEAIDVFDKRIDDFITDERQARLDWEAAEALSRHGWETEQERKLAAFEAMFVSEYDETASYTAGDICTEGGKIYAANASTTGTFDPTKWDEIVLADYLAAYVAEAAEDLQDQYDQFLEDYQRSFGVVQVTGTSTTDVMSQDAVTKTIRSETVPPVGANIYLGNLLLNWVDNRYLNDVTGNLNINPAYAGCDFFPVSPSTQYRWKGIYRLGFYDSNKQFISALSPISTQIVTTPANAAYARADLLKADATPLIAFFGTETDWNKQVDIKNLKLPIVQTTGSSTASIMSQKAVTDSISGLSSVYAPHAATNLYIGNLLKEWVDNKYLNVDTGNLNTNPAYIGCDFFPVSPSTPYYWRSITRLAFYDSNHALIIAYNAIPTRPITSPANAAYARADLLKADATPLIACFATETDWNKQVDIKNLKLPIVQTTGSSTSSIMSQKAVTDAINTAVHNEFTYLPGSSVVSGSLETGDTFTIKTDNIKKNCTYCFAGTYTAFTSVTFGHGKTQYESSYVTIDATNIYIHKYKNALVTETIPHGLTMGSYIKCCVQIAEDGTATITLTTNGSSFTTNTGREWYGDGAGSIFAECVGTFTEATLSYGRADTQKDVWCFGDSYFGISSNDRWCYYLINGGHTNMLLNAYGGENSANAVTALRNLLEVGKPKMILWAMGMNDGNDSGDTPASAWSTNLQTMLQICDGNNIDVVLATIPTVPTVNNEAKNAYVRASGRRYIDFAAAVGASSSGVWYNDMLSYDEVHPSAKGARELYMQAITQMPELLY